MHNISNTKSLGIKKWKWNEKCVPYFDFLRYVLVKFELMVWKINLITIVSCGFLFNCVKHVWNEIKKNVTFYFLKLRCLFFKLFISKKCLYKTYACYMYIQSLKLFSSFTYAGGRAKTFPRLVGRRNMLKSFSTQNWISNFKENKECIPVFYLIYN